MILKKYIFKNFVECMPKISLKKGKSYPYIEMADIQPGNRFVSDNKIKVLKGGGAKFQKDDILFARITPCLENGKISQIKSLSNKHGFGSTEFFVFRDIPNISDKNYLYYLCYSDKIRKPAEKSMVGASGRQRADIKVIENLEIEVPEFADQQKIGKILSNYDELIENNNRRIRILEEMAQLIYDEWFVKFKFPGHKNTRFVDSELGKIPEGWEVKTIDYFVDKINTKYVEKKHCDLPLIDLARIPRKTFSIIDFGKSDEIKTSRIIFNKKDILFGSIRPYFHKVIFAPINGITNVSVFVLRSKKEIFNAYSLFTLFNTKTVDWATQNSQGTKMPVIKWELLKNMKVLLPNKDLLKKYNELMLQYIELINTLILKNQNLIKTRDMLLPKLISGEIDVSDIEINNLTEDTEK